LPGSGGIIPGSNSLILQALRPKKSIIHKTRKHFPAQNFTADFLSFLIAAKENKDVLE
jgi:hypothetical protein